MLENKVGEFILPWFQNLLQSYSNQVWSWNKNGHWITNMVPRAQKLTLTFVTFKKGIRRFQWGEEWSFQQLLLTGQMCFYTSSTAQTGERLEHRVHMGVRSTHTAGKKGFPHPPSPRGAALGHSLGQWVLWDKREQSERPVSLGFPKEARWETHQLSGSLPKAVAGSPQQSCGTGNCGVTYSKHEREKVPIKNTTSSPVLKWR